MENIKVSIIIPIYKIKEEYLRKCIMSAINQTLKEIEIILVDDESPDESGEICDEYALQDHRISVIHQKNKGLCGARNAGYFKAKGKYICFVDADDWIDSNMCEIMYDYASKDDIDIISCRTLREYENRTEHFKYGYETNKIYDKYACKELQKDILNFRANNASVYAKLIKTEVLRENNIVHNEELRQGAEGIEFNVRLYGAIQKAMFIKEEFYHYRYNNESISNKHDEQNHQYVLKCFETIKAYINTLENKQELLESFYNRMVYVIITTAISGYFNPNNKEKYSVKKKKYTKYLKYDLVQETLQKADCSKLDIERKIVFTLIKRKIFFAIHLLAIIRKKQKET